MFDSPEVPSVNTYSTTTVTLRPVHTYYQSEKLIKGQSKII